MNLQQFLTLTEGTEEQELRRAMVLALAWETPYERAGYQRFYRNVLGVLQAKDTNPVDTGYGSVGFRLTTWGSTCCTALGS